MPDSLSSSTPAPKKSVAKAATKRRLATKGKPRRQMTAALAKKRALGWADGRKIDNLPLLRTLR